MRKQINNENIAESLGFKIIDIPTHNFETGVKKVDLLDYFIEDLFEYRYPRFYKKVSETEFKNFKKEYLKDNHSVWAYYPWLMKAYKIPKEKDFLEVLTSRNKPLVSVEEQKNFYSFNVGVVGLSVGQSSAITIIRSGGAKNIKIADPDKISPSNLNRLHVGIGSIGKDKTDELAKKLLEINPFLNIEMYKDGVNEDNCEEFFTDGFKLNVIIDACDNFLIKLKIREIAKKYKIPVVMSTDLGDGALMDIERYDVNPNIEPFGGRHKNIKNANDFQKAAISIISPENIPLSLQDRFFEIGKTTPTHPQLATSVYFAGALVCYLVRCLANKQEISDERVLIDYNEFFDPKYKAKNFAKIKEEKLKVFIDTLGLEQK